MGIFSKNETGPFEVLGKPLACLVCGHDEFDDRKAQLNTAMATLFNVDWANPSAVCLICKRCGYIHWFMPKP